MLYSAVLCAVCCAVLCAVLCCVLWSSDLEDGHVEAVVVMVEYMDAGSLQDLVEGGGGGGEACEGVLAHIATQVL